MPIVTITDAARRVIDDLRSNEADAADLALRIDVTGVADSGREYAYDLYFAKVADAGPDDDVTDVDGLPVFVAGSSLDRLRGATLDHTETTGLVIRNPNRPSPTIEHHEVVLEGTVEERIQQLMDGEINPSLAVHGGFATLERVDGDVAYITMGGGCQGCGLARVTLSEGIKTTIEERIPEINQVVDLTDHAAGDNPFFQPTA